MLHACIVSVASASAGHLTVLSNVQDQAKDLQPAEQAKAAADDQFDITQGRHKGQFALRKLYHESDRVIVVLYTSPTCGPCRTLKPIFSKVVDEYENKVCLLAADSAAHQQLSRTACIRRYAVEMLLAGFLASPVASHCLALLHRFELCGGHMLNMYKGRYWKLAGTSCGD